MKRYMTYPLIHSDAQFHVFFVERFVIRGNAYNSFDDPESKQNNNISESIHKFKYMYPWGLGVEPPKEQNIPHDYCRWRLTLT